MFGVVKGFLGTALRNLVPSAINWGLNKLTNSGFMQSTVP